MTTVPQIDLAALDAAGGLAAIGAELDRACRDTGFFVVVGHGIDPSLFATLDAAARRFFALPESAKAKIAMSVGGRAWRGWFPLGGEVTNGIPDRKEGLYLGQELGDDDSRVAAKVPLHGRNLFPAEVPELAPAVLAWIDALTMLGHQLMAGIAVGLGLPDDWFRANMTADPTVLMRIFRYPDSNAVAVAGAGEWGVAEHTDYGLLTMLAQDDRGGLQVRAGRDARDGARDGSRGGEWIDVDPVPNSFVCNIGDMLERMTGGRYRSTPHRVRNSSGRDRLSFPVFFDPSWDARIRTALPGHAPAEAAGEPSDRWDRASVFDFDGTYGEYLVAKVSKVFPDLVHVI